jgi:hypothetical protein
MTTPPTMEDQLHLFSAGSMNNDKFKNLWVQGAALFIPQLNRLLDLADAPFNVVSIDEFQNNCIELGNTFVRNRTDKAGYHYHILYSYIINRLGGQNAKINLLEIGMGTNNEDLVSSMGWNGRPGASLYAFREYLPNAMLYGCDIDRAILVDSERIKTCYVDQMDATTFDQMVQYFGESTKYDLIIDDGLHSMGANFNTLLFALEHVADNGWIVIEDIQTHHRTNWRAIDYIMNSELMKTRFETFRVQSSGGFMYVVHKIG